MGKGVVFARIVVFRDSRRGRIDFEEFESRAIALGHAAIAEAMSLSLERKDASLCAALGDGLAVHDRRPKTLASEIGISPSATGAPATGTATPSSPWPIS
ncbi:MAG: hypothetical protein ACLTDR_13375 [Adlercreutzia equolifaciens]